MKKLIIFLLAAITGCASAHAQHRFRYGFRVGGGLATQSYNNPSVQSVDAIRVLSAALVGEAPLYGPYRVQLALGIANKGSTVYEDALTTTNKLLYLQANLNVVRKFNLPELGKLVIGFGPYIGRGQSGTLEYETPSSSTSDYITYGTDNNDFKTLDTGINIMAGLELNNKLTFTLGYDYGLSNIASQVLKDTGNKSIRNRVISANLGFLF